MVDRGRATVITALAAALLLPACASTPTDDVRLSVKRIALSLAFEDEELIEPVPPRQIISVIPAPPELIASGDITPYRTLPDLPTFAPEPPLCPTAPVGTALTEVVAVRIDEPPKPGWYRRHNRGKLSVAGGAIPITLPFPRVTLMEIRDVHEVERPNADRRAGDVASDEAPPAADAASTARGTTKATRFTVAHEIATITITDVYEYDGAGLRLVERTIKTDAATSVFTPTPQVTLVELGNFGNEWTEGGADRDTSTAMVVEGAITRQEPVDVCGNLVDSLRYENDEQTVNLGTQEVSGTQDVPNAYNIAPQRNGLIVREEKHFSQVMTVGDLKLVIDWDYVSTIGHFDPYPTREAALRSLRDRG
jgi:hypothetical protein